MNAAPLEGVTVIFTVTASLRLLRRAFLAALLRLTVNRVVPAPADLVDEPTLICLLPLRPSADGFASSSTVTRDPARATAIEPLTA